MNPSPKTINQHRAGGRHVWRTGSQNVTYFASARLGSLEESSAWLSALVDASPIPYPPEGDKMVDVLAGLSRATPRGRPGRNYTEKITSRGVVCGAKHALKAFEISVPTTTFCVIFLDGGERGLDIFIPLRTRLDPDAFFTY